MRSMSKEQAQVIEMNVTNQAEQPTSFRMTRADYPECGHTNNIGVLMSDEELSESAERNTAFDYSQDGALRVPVLVDACQLFKDAARDMNLNGVSIHVLYASMYGQAYSVHSEVHRRNLMHLLAHELEITLDEVVKLCMQYSQRYVYFNTRLIMIGLQSESGMLLCGHRATQQFGLQKNPATKRVELTASLFYRALCHQPFDGLGELEYYRFPVELDTCFVWDSEHFLWESTELSGDAAHILAKQMPFIDEATCLHQSNNATQAILAQSTLPEDNPKDLSGLMIAVSDLICSPRLPGYMAREKLEAYSQFANDWCRRLLHAPADEFETIGLLIRFRSEFEYHFSREERTQLGVERIEQSLVALENVYQPLEFVCFVTQATRWSANAAQKKVRQTALSDEQKAMLTTFYRDKSLREEKELTLALWLALYPSEELRSLEDHFIKDTPIALTGSQSLECDSHIERAKRLAERVGVQASHHQCPRQRRDVKPLRQSAQSLQVLANLFATNTDATDSFRSLVDEMSVCVKRQRQLIRRQRLVTFVAIALLPTALPSLILLGMRLRYQSQIKRNKCRLSLMFQDSQSSVRELSNAWQLNDARAPLRAVHREAPRRRLDH